MAQCWVDRHIDSSIDQSKRSMDKTELKSKTDNSWAGSVAHSQMPKLMFQEQMPMDSRTAAGAVSVSCAPPCSQMFLKEGRTRCLPVAEQRGQ